jgi:hypothetical protein
MGELTLLFSYNSNIVDMRNCITALTITACMGRCLLYALPSAAQAPQQDTTATNPIRLSPQQLQTYAGFFQFSRYDKWVLQVKAVEGGIMVKSLWLREEVRLTPLSDSTFYSPHGFGGDPMTLTFGKKKNKEGRYEQLALGDIPSWDRIYGYKPNEPVAIRRTPEQLKEFEGLYQDGADRGPVILIKAGENKLLVMRLWVNDEFEALPDSPMHFFDPKNLTFTLQFEKGREGAISGLTFDNEPFGKLQSPSLTPALMKTFEGKYRLKEDSDDVILISARDLSLVMRQLWDGKETVVDPLADFYFYNKAQKYSVAFRKDEAGAIIGVLVLNKDLFQKVKE